MFLFHLQCNCILRLMVCVYFNIKYSCALFLFVNDSNERMFKQKMKYISRGTYIFMNWNALSFHFFFFFLVACCFIFLDIIRTWHIIVLVCPHKKKFILKTCTNPKYCVLFAYFIFQSGIFAQIKEVHRKEITFEQQRRTTHGECECVSGRHRLNSMNTLFNGLVAG